MLLTILGYVVLSISLLMLLFISIDRFIRSKGYNGPSSDHFNGTIFLNILDRPIEEPSTGRRSMFRWIITRKKNLWENRTVEKTKPVAQVMGSELIATLINHATVLIQTEGLNILTDPIYSKRASPFSFLGPARYTEPGVAFDDLPKIDVVIISHNHYDHLDIPTLKRIAKRDNPRIFVPLGNADFLKRYGLKNSTELDWWQSDVISSNFSVLCVPAQHFSARGLSDRNKTLWSGWAFQTPHGDMYFAGDTGFGPFVDQIAKHFPDGFRFGLLPIGAFRPQEFMHKVHISPDQAFTIQDCLAIEDVLAIHFGTFKLAGDEQDEPSNRVVELSKNLP
jgi:L-ascorbate metabolism protein UlaG (beta-lactamase superfamily)